MGSIPTASATPLLRKWSARPVETRKEPVRFRRGALRESLNGRAPPRRGGDESSILSSRTRDSTGGAVGTGHCLASRDKRVRLPPPPLPCKAIGSSPAMPSSLNGRAPLRYGGDCGFDSRRRLSSCPRVEMDIMRGYEPRVGGSTPSGDTASRSRVETEIIRASEARVASSILAESTPQ